MVRFSKDGYAIEVEASGNPAEDNVDWNFNPGSVGVFPNILRTGYGNIEGLASVVWIPQLGNFAPNTIDRDPSFVYPGNGNYRLSNNSVSAGAGSNAQAVGITIDLDGTHSFIDFIIALLLQPCAPRSFHPSFVRSKSGSMGLYLPVRNKVLAGTNTSFTGQR